jgi:bifunctional DNase/RNase
VISKLQNDTFYAKLVISQGKKQHEIDCRPSDALAVAIRVDVPIFVNEQVLEKAGVNLDEK